MDKELREYLEGFKGELKRHIEESLDTKVGELRQVIYKEFHAKAEELKQHSGIIYEEFQKRIDLVVECHEVLDRKIDELKEEIASELKETRLMMKTLFKDVDHRVKVLERTKR